jgi:hypothetical protein
VTEGRASISLVGRPRVQVLDPSELEASKRKTKWGERCGDRGGRVEGGGEGAFNFGGREGGEGVGDDGFRRRMGDVPAWADAPMKTVAGSRKIDVGSSK